MNCLAGVSSHCFSIFKIEVTLLEDDTSDLSFSLQVSAWLRSALSHCFSIIVNIEHAEMCILKNA